MVTSWKVGRWQNCLLRIERKQIEGLCETVHVGELNSQTDVLFLSSLSSEE